MVSAPDEIVWKNFLDSLPWKEAVLRGWIQKQSSRFEQGMEILRFFGVASPKEYEKVYGCLETRWRPVSQVPSDRHATAFWLRQGEREAARLERDAGFWWNDYREDEFSRSLGMLREVTREGDPAMFIPTIQKLCAVGGVAVIFVPEFDGTRTDSAARWLSPVRALIQISLQHETRDQFWVQFYHLAQHVRRHSRKRLYLEHYEQTPTDDSLEQAADRWAWFYFTFPNEFAKFLRKGRPDRTQIVAFAERARLDTGIVVGWLQRENVLRPDEFNDLKQPWDRTRAGSVEA